MVQQQVLLSGSAVLLLFCWQAAAVLEYETDVGWKMASDSAQVSLQDIRGVLVHTTDKSVQPDGQQLPALRCQDSTTGLTTWMLQLPTCRELFHEQNCVYCASKRNSCCSLELECSSCIEQHYMELRNPRLLCSAYHGNSLRTIDASSCVLELQLSQSKTLTHIEIAVATWLFCYNLCLLLVLSSFYSSSLAKLREGLMAVCLSSSILPMFWFYLYIQSWHVLLPFSAVYVILCLVVPYRLVLFRLRVKTEKELV